MKLMSLLVGRIRKHPPERVLVGSVPLGDRDYLPLNVIILWFITHLFVEAEEVILANTKVDYPYMVW